MNISIMNVEDNIKLISYIIFGIIGAAVNSIFMYIRMYKGM